MENTNSYLGLNSELNIYDKDGQIQFDKDREAAKQFFLEHVNPNTRFFHDLEEKLDYLINEEGYYEAEVFEQYTSEFIKSIYQRIYAYKYRFSTFVGAYKFYTGYALKERDGKGYLERYEDRIAVVALYLARGDQELAIRLADEMIAQRIQPATPTFLNAGKKARGELVSCFLLEVSDNMNSIGRSINSALQLSKRGGGVAFNLTSIRGEGDPIKGIENQSSGILPVMKLLEDSFSYANQLGARQGAGAVYLNAHHPDIEKFLDCKRTAADEKIRIKTLSLGVIIPDITLQLAAANENMCLFSPYDVEKEYGKSFSDINMSEMYDELVANPNVKKRRINARKFFQTLAEVQFESGYPYIMFEDNVNNANPIKGKVRMSNLCTEILQVSIPSVINDKQEYEILGKDISCNLASLNISNVMESPDILETVDTAVRALTAVSDLCDISTVPSIQSGNAKSHAIGVGQMNLHGFLAKNHIMYGDDESIDFTHTYFMLMNYATLKASMEIAKETGIVFDGFEDSKYATGEYFNKYTNTDYRPSSAKVQELFANHFLPSPTEWAELAREVMHYGLYHAYRQAIAPTGSISYVNHATASIHPITSPIEIRKEGKMGRVYYPAAHMNNENIDYFVDAYTLGYKPLIDVYAAATEHVDQGLSLTLFVPEDATTRDINKAQVYAWRKGIKTIYYIRVRSIALEGTDIEGCVSCAV